MRLTLIGVGRLKAGPERELFERYFKRLSDLARSQGISEVELREVDEGRARRAQDRQAEEARAILAAAPKGGWLALLDERGAAMTSVQWAAEIGKARDGAAPAYAVVIGGPDGLDPALRAEARTILSFGAMTWPHQLVRAMASEQLYRALSILGGHPYHRQ
ncbi:MAG: 23S rRNA (pseudouridine(1915)-N(3))-methyltransferase RlmH [Hyphomicrobiales bacterium]|nr:23S rRNA (pseudouridine(1915)-N(3))-methyltransferase RlmH [Hyphomicrobiales bacterium]MBV8663093.1 23S rRNA (pseudouridine(1915)-N(3))-methyltransferase RlmH [Hyphomicrobiales bacterium]